MSGRVGSRQLAYQFGINEFNEINEATYSSHILLWLLCALWGCHNDDDDDMKYRQAAWAPLLSFSRFPKGCVALRNRGIAFLKIEFYEDEARRRRRQLPERHTQIRRGSLHCHKWCPIHCLNATDATARVEIRFSIE